MGRQHQQGSNPNEVSKSVAEIVLHPNYTVYTSDNDVALLRLSSPVEFTDYIRPVCLAANGSEVSSGTETWVTGWGDIEDGGEKLFKMDAALQITTVKIMIVNVYII